MAGCPSGSWGNSQQGPNGDPNNGEGPNNNDDFIMEDTILIIASNPDNGRIQIMMVIMHRSR